MGYLQFVQQMPEAIAAYPKLKKESSLNGSILKGSLDIVDKNGKYWDSYKIEIHYADGFPFRFPSLFETGGKIPKIGDWHIYEDTLACCVKVEPEEIIRCQNRITVVEYIREEALPYLFNQTHRRVEGHYVNGEYAHGVAGLLEFYSEQLKTGGDIYKTLQLLHFIFSNPRPRQTATCFCDNGKKFRHCHRDAYDRLKLIGDETLKQHLHTIGKAANIFK